MCFVSWSKWFFPTFHGSNCCLTFLFLEMFEEWFLALVLCYFSTNQIQCSFCFSLLGEQNTFTASVDQIVYCSIRGDKKADFSYLVDKMNRTCEFSELLLTPFNRRKLIIYYGCFFSLCKKDIRFCIQDLVCIIIHIDLFSILKNWVKSVDIPSIVLRHYIEYNWGGGSGVLSVKIPKS